MKHLVEVELVIRGDNDAFVDDPAGEVARLISEVAYDIKHSSEYCERNIYDTNGNKVGAFSFEVNHDD